MTEINLLTLFAGVLLSSLSPMRPANPFQIYFLIWFFVFFGYCLGAETYIAASNVFLLLIWIANLIAISLLFLSRSQAKKVFINPEDRFIPHYRLMFWAQIAVILAVPFVYQKANELSDASIFTVIGYTNLRRAITEDGQSFGGWGYFSILSYVISSIKFYDFLRNRKDRWGVLISLATGLFYAYVGTGRTFFLLFAVLMVLPAASRGMIGLRGALTSFFLLILTFLLVASLTAKGISVDADLGSNIVSLLEDLRGYTVAPLLALHNFITSSPPAMWGQNTFRFFIAILSSIGMTRVEPVALIREYQFVPDPTNVYTVYEAYFRDFSYAGMLLPPLFLLGHWALYCRAIKQGGVWLFYYSASTYPLVMQFFQDQYFSLFSMWIQIAFWFWAFLGSRRFVLARPSR